MELRPTESEVKDSELDVIGESEHGSAVVAQEHGYGDDDKDLSQSVIVIEVIQKYQSIEDLKVNPAPDRYLVIIIIHDEDLHQEPGQERKNDQLYEFAEPRIRTIAVLKASGATGL